MTEKALTIDMICKHAIEVLHGNVTLAEQINFIVQNVPDSPRRTDLVQRVLNNYDRFSCFYRKDGRLKL
jgi:hypothetical protein